MFRSAVLLLLLCGIARASPLFDDDSILDLTLEGPLSATLKDREERHQRPFTLHVAGKTIPVKVRVRGKLRADECRFPPLRLNFPAEQSSDTVFSGENKLKLVTHCKKSSDYEKNVIEEYAAYRIMNVLSDVSLRARLLRIRYLDTDRPESDVNVRLAFVVEPDAAIAERLGGEMLQVRDVVKGMFNAEHEALVFIFQYLIGNTDWSYLRMLEDDSCCHNGRLIRVGDQNYYLPYDFDMSGLVNARYAEPNPALRLRSVKIRRYRGYCTDSAALDRALQFVVGKREEILGLVADLPESTPTDRRSRMAYIEKFFDKAARQDKLLKDFERRCLD
ncbi:MAG: hypothetical protein KJO46_08275 [Gammaproteobacteria bacterium]|nr:hypothetical protein [Gammaproteobacteria bacterium]